MIESVLHCGERAMPGSWSWLTLNCPLDRESCPKSLLESQTTREMLVFRPKADSSKSSLLKGLNYCYAWPARCICQNA